MPLPIWFLLTFLFLLGAVVGSFLNVVIYRLPRGLSLVRPGSKCPNCDHPIRWYDNVPILGWLVLGGRCRDCGLAISVRYPLVEAAIGLMFMAVGYADMIRPMQHADQLAAAQVAAANAGAVAGADQMKVPVVENQNLETGDYVWPVAFHLLLLCALLAAVMIDVDGQRLPRQLITWPAAGGILLAIFRPTLHVFPLFHVQPVVTDGISLISAGDFVCGNARGGCNSVGNAAICGHRQGAGVGALELHAGAVWRGSVFGLAGGFGCQRVCDFVVVGRTIGAAANGCHAGAANSGCFFSDAGLVPNGTAINLWRLV